MQCDRMETEKHFIPIIRLNHLSAVFRMKLILYGGNNGHQSSSSDDALLSRRSSSKSVRVTATFGIDGVRSLLISSSESLLLLK